MYVQYTTVLQSTTIQTPIYSLNSALSTPWGLSEHPYVHTRMLCRKLWQDCLLPCAQNYTLTTASVCTNLYLYVCMYVCMYNEHTAYLLTDAQMFYVILVVYGRRLLPQSQKASYNCARVAKPTGYEFELCRWRQCRFFRASLLAARCCI